MVPWPGWFSVRSHGQSLLARARRPLLPAAVSPAFRLDGLGAAGPKEAPQAMSVPITAKGAGRSRSPFPLFPFTLRFSPPPSPLYPLRSIPCRFVHSPNHPITQSLNGSGFAVLHMCSTMCNFLRAEHVRRFWGESPRPSLMEAKG